MVCELMASDPLESSECGNIVGTLSSGPGGVVDETVLDQAD
jgi:hypothetical protein